MLDLTWWWALWLIPLPLIARRLLPSTNNIESALYIPLLRRYPPDQSVTASSSARLAKFSLWCFWICLVLAACRPFWLGEPTHRVISGRDIMLAIDISGSMREADMRIGTRANGLTIILNIALSTGIPALAEPSWQKRDYPLLESAAARVMVLDLSQSMRIEDVKPSRLEKALDITRQIIDSDFDGETALVVFAGAAFTVSPLTVIDSISR